MSKEKKNISRRTYIGSVAAAAVAAGVGGYFAGRSGRQLPITERAPTTEVRTQTVPLVENPVKMGVMNDFTELMAAMGLQVQKGVQTAVREINAAGGILGRKVETVDADIPNWAPEAVDSALEKLLGVDKVDMVGFGGAPGVVVPGNGYDTVAKYSNAIYCNLDTSMACQKLLKEQKDKYWMIFMADPPDQVYAIGLAWLLNDLLKKGEWQPLHDPPKIALLRGQTDYANNITTVFNEEIIKLGWEVVHDEVVPFGTVEYTGLLSKLRPLEPDLLHYTNPDVPGQAALTNQFAEAPMPALIYFQYGPADPAYLQLTGPNANGILWSTVLGLTIDKEGFAGAWRDNFIQAFNEDPLLGQAATSYDQVYLYKFVAEQAGTTDIEDWAKTAEHMIPYRGICGSYYWGYPKSEDHTSMAYPWEGMNYYWHEGTADPSFGAPHTTWQIQDVTRSVEVGEPFLPYHKCFYPDPYTTGKFKMPKYFEK